MYYIRHYHCTNVLDEVEFTSPGTIAISRIREDSRRLMSHDTWPLQRAISMCASTRVRQRPTCKACGENLLLHKALFGHPLKTSKPLHLTTSITFPQRHRICNKSRRATCVAKPSTVSAFLRNHLHANLLPYMK